AGVGRIREQRQRVRPLHHPVRHLRVLTCAHVPRRAQVMWRRNGARRIATRTASAIAALTVIAAGTAGGAAAKAPAGAAQGPPQSPAAVPGGYTLVHSRFIS